MTRKHYEAMAAIIREQVEASQDGSRVRDVESSGAYVRNVLGVVARDMARVFAQDNPRFDRSRFLAACGIGE